MKCKTIFVVLGVILLVLSISNMSVGQEKATPQEVVQKVQQAANTLVAVGRVRSCAIQPERGPLGVEGHLYFRF